MPPERLRMADGQVPSGHVDTFCADRLPPPELLPLRTFDALPALRYPERLNGASVLLEPRRHGADRERCAIVYPGGSWTYGHLEETTARIARVLVEELGVVAGNRVLLRAPNTPMLAACWLAVLEAGGVVVCTMALLREREIQSIADTAAITLALSDARCAGDCVAAFATHRDGTPRAGARVVQFSHDGGGDAELDRLMRTKPPAFIPCDTAAEDIAIIAFTSGTTGQGKGTMHSHRDLLAVTDCFPPHVLRPTADDLFCGSPPLAFTYALGGLLLFPLRVGASTLLLEQATPPHLVTAIQEYRPTICFTAPTAYRAMCGLVVGHDVSSLRACVSAGETLPRSVYDAWRSATGLRIIDGIGATEMLHIFISASGDDIRAGSTGRVVPGYEAVILGDAMEPVPDGVVGRLAVRGPTGCRYLDSAARQREYVQQGWNLTGDSYLRDADGYFWYQARTDDIIVSSGYNIAGPEVENVLLEHPAVLECAVVGTPDEERGQLVTAVIVLRPGREGGAVLVKELQDFVKARIAPYKYPRAVQFAPSLPRTSTGKLQRFRLREDIA